MYSAIRTCAILFLTILISLTACTHFHVPRLFAKNPHQFRLMTYNVNWGKDDDWKVTKPQATLKAMDLTNADMILLQEITPTWERLIRQKFYSKYPYQQFRQIKNSCGFAVLSKFPFTTRFYIDPHIGWYPVWIMTTMTPLGKMQIANLHLTPPLVSESDMGFLASAVFTTPAVRLAEAHYVYSLLNPKLTTIIAGDFNENETGSAVQFMRNHFYDVFKIERPPIYTWRWESPLFTLTDRLDHIFYSRDLMQVRLQVLKAGNSDHYPLIVDLVKTR